MEIVHEEWRPVVGRFAGWNYEVSSLGRVRSLHTRRNRGAADGILAEYANNSNYRLVMLSKDRVHKNVTVHSLVAEAFIRERGPGDEVNHIDGNKTNNKLENLEWVGKSENALHAIRTGIRKSFSGGSSKGQENPGAKLTNEQAKAIRVAFDAGERRKAIALRHGVSVGVVERIGSRQAWKHLAT